MSRSLSFLRLKILANSITSVSAWDSIFANIVPMRRAAARQLKQWVDSVTVVRIRKEVEDASADEDIMAHLKSIVSHHLWNVYVFQKLDTPTKISQAVLTEECSGVGGVTAIEHRLVQAFLSGGGPSFEIEQEANQGSFGLEKEPDQDAVGSDDGCISFQQYRDMVMPTWPNVNLQIRKWGNINYVVDLMHRMDAAHPSLRYSILRGAVSSRLSRIYDKKRISSVEEALKLAVIHQNMRGVGVQTEVEQGIVQKLFGCKVRLPEIEKRHKTTATTRQYHSISDFKTLADFFSDLIRACSNGPEDERRIVAFNARYCLCEEAVSLESVADRYGVSRARIHAILSSVEKQVFEKNRDCLTHIKDFMFSSLVRHGFCVDLKELAADIDSQFQLQNTPEQAVLKLLYKFFDKRNFSYPRKWRGCSADPKFENYVAYRFEENCREHFRAAVETILATRIESYAREAILARLKLSCQPSVDSVQVDFFVRSFIGSGDTFVNAGYSAEAVNEAKARLRRYYLNIDEKPKAAIRADAVRESLFLSGKYGMTMDEIVAQVNLLHPELCADVSSLRSVIVNSSPVDPGDRIIVAQKGGVSLGKSRYALLRFFKSDELCQIARRAVEYLRHWMSLHGVWVCNIGLAYTEFSREIPHWCTERNLYDIMRDEISGLFMPKYPRVFLSRAAKESGGNNVYLSQACDYFRARGCVTCTEDEVKTFFRDVLGVSADQTPIVMATIPRVSLRRGADILLERE